MMKSQKHKMLTAADILRAKLAEIDHKTKPDPNYISQEFQDYGYRLALRLDDAKHKALYIRLSKVVPRALVEDAAAFTDSYTHAKSRGKVFMWKLSQLLGEYKEKHPEFKLPKLYSKGEKKSPKVKVAKQSANLALFE